MQTINHLGETLGEACETFHPVSEKQGRVFGYAFGFRHILEGGAGVYAWCQYSVSGRDGFDSFGRYQGSQKFENIEQAREWFIQTKAARIEQNRAKWLRDGHRIVN